MKEKLPCPDCLFCQECGKNRCSLCQKKGCTTGGKGRSIAQQIEQYNRLNPNLGRSTAKQPDTR